MTIRQGSQGGPRLRLCGGRQREGGGKGPVIRVVDRLRNRTDGSNYILPSCAVVMMKAAFDSEDIQVQDNHDDDDETLPPTPRSLASKPRARMTGRAFPPQAPFSSRSNHQTSKRPRLRFLPLIQLGAAQVRALGKGKGERPPTHCQLSPSGARLLASK
jgi:hypothetical protein